MSDSATVQLKQLLCDWAEEKPTPFTPSCQTTLPSDRVSVDAETPRSTASDQQAPSAIGKSRGLKRTASTEPVGKKAKRGAATVGRSDRVLRERTACTKHKGQA